MATYEEILVAHFMKKFPADSPLIWKIWTAMSVNDLINYWEQTILKCCNICGTQNQSKIAGPCI